jgi:hypothetical protein
MISKINRKKFSVTIILATAIGGHGRIEERHCVAINSDYIAASSRGSGIQSAVAVYSNQLIDGGRT